jgi:hypothetical protein
VSAACLACHRGPATFVDATLCASCWNGLSAQTRARLRQRDHDVQARVFQLLSAIRRAVPLARIEITA